MIKKMTKRTALNFTILKILSWREPVTSVSLFKCQYIPPNKDRINTTVEFFKWVKGF